jgi:uncharacterized membrane protein YjjP (DUF1212 family)
LLSAGMSANDVVVVALRITRTYGLRRVHFDVTYTSISASYYPAPGVPPITCIRTVQPDIIDYTQVRALDQLSTDIEHGLPLSDAAATFLAIRTARRRYPGWVSMLGNAGVGVGTVLLFTASWKVLLITLISGCLLDRLLVVLGRARVPPFFSQFAGAAMMTLIAAGAYAAGRRGVEVLAGVDPTVIVVGGIVMLVAGMTIVGAMQDAIDQFYVTASARVLEVVLLTAGIVVGIVAVLQIAFRVGAPVAISPDPVELGPLGAQFLGAGLICASFAVWAYADLATIALAAVIGLLGWAGYTATAAVGAGEVPANALGALAAAFVATLLIRRSSIPGFALVSAAILPLVPGLSLYNGLLQLTGTSPGSGDLAAGVGTLLLAVSIASASPRVRPSAPTWGVRSWTSSGASGDDTPALTVGDQQKRSFWWFIPRSSRIGYSSSPVTETALCVEPSDAGADLGSLLSIDPLGRYPFR